MHMMPGQPFNNLDRLTQIILANLESKYGLDQPLWEHYSNNIVHFDLGTSFRYENESVNHIIATRFPVDPRILLAKRWV